AGFACFVCNKEGSSLEQEEGICTLCPTVALSIRSAFKIVEHMAIHILFDRNPPIDRDSYPCGFCLSTGSFCSILLKKRKGRDGANQIDMNQSRCPNLVNLGLANTAKSSDKRPCTNVPLYCPIPSCADVIWKYNLKNHIQKTHPSANILTY
ncbi:hypothetical protein B0H10DRAFT_1717438, partial [Mycena sp. CBHHK59/15]